MAVVVRQPKDGEHQALTALMKYFDWTANECYPNVVLFPWESDLLVVSSSRYVTEIEVKISLNDWKSDIKKDKFVRPRLRDEFEKRVKRFYYAVPEALYDKYVEQPFEVVPAAGILVLKKGWSGPSVSERREPKASVNAKALDTQQVHRLHRSVYFRFNREYVKGVHRNLPQEAIK